MDDACRDALARVGWKVVPAHVRAEIGRWRDLDDAQRQALIAGINQLGAVLYPFDVSLAVPARPARPEETEARQEFCFASG